MINNSNYLFFNFFKKNINTNLFIYSFLYLFWISFLSIVNIFVLFIYLNKFINSFDFYFIDLLVLFKFYNVCFSEYTNLVFFWFFFIFSFFLKLGLVPFFLWKPNFFKSIPYIYILNYVVVFYFFFFIYFIYILFSVFYLFNFYLSFINFFICFITIFILFILLYNITNFKIFLSFSSIINSFFLFFIFIII